ncbi:tyrosine-type recombinase/integrase [Kribbella sp. NPDC049584]|uniref:tyrosine-type recombinase/integrase n=1 Tax=Kribbella sp. NPDC049584 TaxID=3154833 RepID=UPI003428A04E
MARQPDRINAVLVAVREFLKHAVAPARVLSALYEIGDDRWLPEDLRGERTGLRFVARPRHRLSVPERQSARSSDDDALALLGACRSARDRFIVVLLGRAGLRRGEAAGLWRRDMHMALDSRSVGCDVPGEHLHVVRREDAPNGAIAKSPRSRIVPLDFLVVQAHDAYCWERQDVPAAAGCDFVLVNLFREPLGAPMRPGAVTELLAALSRRTVLERPVHPHMLRHAFASNVLDAGGTLDEAQALLRHASLASTQVYAHPAPERLRAAVDRLAPPRGADDCPARRTRCGPGRRPGRPAAVSAGGVAGSRVLVRGRLGRRTGTTAATAGSSAAGVVTLLDARLQGRSQQPALHRLQAAANGERVVARTVIASAPAKKRGGAEGRWLLDERLCQVSGCQRPIHARTIGLCNSHSLRCRELFGRLDAADVPPFLERSDVRPFPSWGRCQVGACLRLAYNSAGLCHRHSQRWNELLRCEVATDFAQWCRREDGILVSGVANLRALPRLVVVEFLGGLQLRTGQGSKPDHPS